MHKLALILGFVLFAFLVLASRNPAEWKLTRRARPHERVTFHVALKQRNVKQLEEIAYAVSDPENPAYGKHLSREEVLSIVAPPKAHHDFVMDWFKSWPGVLVDSYGDGLKVVAPADVVEAMFQTKIYQFVHKKRSVAALRQVDGYMIPKAIAPYIEFIDGLTTFPYIRKSVAERLVERGHSIDKRQVNPVYKYVFPGALRQAYNIPPGTVATNPKTNQLAMEFLPVGAPLDSDVQQFCREANEFYRNYSRIIGPWRPGQSDGESTLDVEYLMTVGSKADNWYYTVTDGWVYSMATGLANMTNPPQVVSVSYGWPELDSCDSAITGAHCKSGETNQQYVTRCNTELAKVAARGISVLVATQDEGAAGPTNYDCHDQEHPVYAVFPSSSPWVTAVSGTTLVMRNKLQSDQSDALPPICQQSLPCIDGPVVEWPCMTNNTYFSWTTGGGFSDVTPMPAYQKNVVQAYLAKTNVMKPPSKYFNANNRGYADISAAGSRILVIMNGGLAISAGTSASTPIVAGIITLLNDYRLNNNKPQLGFLNPLLYKMYEQHPSAFHDVTEGDNHCSLGRCCKYGYGATVGWDPVTGLGTPNYQEMLNYIKTLPN
jgi:subtilase family serine protease